MGYGYDYGYDYGYGADIASDVLAGTLGFLAVFFLAIWFIALAISVVGYIFSSLGIYTIAKRRGIHNPWLAWLPIGNVWIQGCISDQYQYVAKGKKTNRRKILLGFSLGSMGLAGVYGVMQIGTVVAAALGDGAATGATMAGSMLIYLAAMVLALVVSVFSYVTMYDMFCSCDPDSSVVYLLLSILVSICMPILFFICRNKDLGMPAPVVRPAQPVQPTQPVQPAQPVQLAEPVQPAEPAQPAEEVEV